MYNQQRIGRWVAEAAPPCRRRACCTTVPVQYYSICTCCRSTCIRRLVYWHHDCMDVKQQFDDHTEAMLYPLPPPVHPSPPPLRVREVIALIRSPTPSVPRHDSMFPTSTVPLRGSPQKPSTLLQSTEPSPPLPDLQPPSLRIWLLCQTCWAGVCSTRHLQWTRIRVTTPHCRPRKRGLHPRSCSRG
jgi:hypothetical protein